MDKINYSRGLELRSQIKSSGHLELTLVSIPTPEPATDEVVVKIEATPINPTDLNAMLSFADVSTAQLSGSPDAPVLLAAVPDAAMPRVAGRLNQSLTVGSEGSGTVVASGSSAEARVLLGKTVAVVGVSTYAQYRIAKVANILVLPEGTRPSEAASVFVNPLTALGMVATMRTEGHHALVLTAAASNLGAMLNKLCISEHIEVVNIVRSHESARGLRDLGVKYVLNSADSDFQEKLSDAIAATGATLAFDPIGGGTIQSLILAAMEKAINRTSKKWNRYGSSVHKQLYIFGRLDLSPTVLQRDFGTSWGIGGWLLSSFLQKAGPDQIKNLQNRVVSELKTTFATHYAREISLFEVLKPDIITAFSKQRTGSKFLINPNS